MKVLSALVILGISYQATAFTLSAKPTRKFSKNKVTIHVSNNNCAQSVTAAELLNLAIKAADETWNKVATCALQLEKGVVQSGIDLSSDDSTAAVTKIPGGSILIGCSDQITGTTLGVGGNTGTDKGYILINDSNTNFANLSEKDKIATLSHEMGHAFGLGHSSDPVALMYYQVGGTIREKLTLDDYDGCTYLYPHDSPGSCNSVALIKGDDTGSGHKISYLWMLMIGFFLSIGGSKVVKRFRF